MFFVCLFVYVIFVFLFFVFVFWFWFWLVLEWVDGMVVSELCVVESCVVVVFVVCLYWDVFCGLFVFGSIQVYGSCVWWGVVVGVFEWRLKKVWLELGEDGECCMCSGE